MSLERNGRGWRAAEELVTEVPIVYQGVRHGTRPQADSLLSIAGSGVRRGTLEWNVPPVRDQNNPGQHDDEEGYRGEGVGEIAFAKEKPSDAGGLLLVYGLENWKSFSCINIIDTSGMKLKVSITHEIATRK